LRERTGPWKNGKAIGGKAPHSDLYISPGHAIYIDGILILRPLSPALDPEIVDVVKIDVIDDRQEINWPSWDR
jgi:hypothetical protein